MSNAATIMTPDNCPRDENILANEGVFIHRRLAENLMDRGFKLWNNEKDKTAFITAGPADRARAIVQKLKEMDAAGGGTPALPPPQPQVQQPPPAVEEAPVKRQPRTNGSAASQAATPASAPAQGPVAGIQELLLVLKGIEAKVAEVSTNQGRLASTDASLGVQVKGLEEQINGVHTLLAAVAQVQQAQLGILCLFGQQVLGAGMEEFLPSAMEDSNAALVMIDKLRGGKG